MRSYALVTYNSMRTVPRYIFMTIWSMHPQCDQCENCYRNTITFYMHVNYKHVCRTHSAIDTHTHSRQRELRFYETTLLYPRTTTVVRTRSKHQSPTIQNAHTTPIAASTTYELSSRKHVVACPPSTHTRTSCKHTTQHQHL